MPHTKAQKLISWEILDKYKTSRGIANFLRKRKIIGISDNATLCPLAIATGYRVDCSVRSRVSPSEDIESIARLTKAEEDFVVEFDLHVYPDLERK